MAESSGLPKTKKELRSKSYATIIYEESAHPNWKESLSSLLVPALVSPIHDRDKNEDGTAKKPHYHVLFIYPSQKSREQATADVQTIGGVGCERVKNITGYARYLIHADNPEKAQYKPSEVQEFCGAKFERYLVAQVDRLAVMREMIAFVRDNKLLCFADLVDIAEAEFPEWFKVLADSRTFLMDYMKSMAWKAGKEFE